MKESISKLQEFITLQMKIEKEYTSIRLEMMQEHFYIRICTDPCTVIHKSPDASFRQTISYLYKQLIDCKPDNTKFINGYAHFINEPSDFSKNFLQVVHAYRTLYQHEPLDADYRKYKKICKEWTLGALNKTSPSNDEEWRKCEHYLLESGIKYLKKGLCILAKFSGGGEMLLEEWFRYQKQDVTLSKAIVVLEKIKSEYGYEFDTEKYYRQYRGKLKESLRFLDWKSQNCEQQIYECFLQVVFRMPPKRKILVQPDEINEKYGIKDKHQIGEIMKKVSAFCRENPKCSRDDVWKYIDSILYSLS